MIKTNRLPKYSENGGPYRVVSRPNGLWAVQKETKYIGFKNKTIDPWEDLPGSSRMTFDAAMSRMVEYDPPKKRFA